MVRTTVDSILRESASKLDLDAKRFSALLYNASLKHFKRKVGLPEEYAPGKPLPRQVYEVDKLMGVDMTPFKVEMGAHNSMPLVVDQNGIATTPTDMYYPSRLTYRYNSGGTTKRRIVRICSDKQWDEFVSSSIEYPTKKYPVANFQNSYIRVNPTNLRYLDFVYIKYPTEPVYATKIENGVQVYDSAASTNMEWDNVNTVDVIAVLLKDIGVSVGRSDIYQVMEHAQNKGL